jgi:1-acyl-sn-glycerol-3-phosphate acyltransferase
VPATGKSLLLSLRNVVETLAVSAPTLADATRGRLSRDVTNARIASWSARVVENAAVSLRVRGRENVEPGVTYVVMSNHQSHYDVAILFHVLGPNMRMVAKKELFALPVFGPALEKAGFVSVDRGDTAAAIASLAQAKAHLASGMHLWIAPEGTRSPSGALLPFKKGGFHLALDVTAPILPITISGTRDVLRAKGVLSRAGVDVALTIHPAVATSSYAGTDRKTAVEVLSRDVRTAIASAL